MAKHTEVLASAERHSVSTMSRVRSCTITGFMTYLGLWAPSMLAAQQEQRVFTSTHSSVASYFIRETPSWRAMRLTPIAPRPFDANLQSYAISVRATSRAHDHRWEGAVVGGLLLGVGLAIVGHKICEDDNSPQKECTRTTVVYGLVGGTVGVVAGGLIGSTIPKGE